MQLTPVSLLLLALLTGSGDCQDEFVCPQKEGQFATFQSCRIFYQCVGGHPHRKHCSGGTWYDGKLHECVHPGDHVNCGPQPEEEKQEDKKPDPFAAKNCDPVECTLPYCHCSDSGTDIPGGLRPHQTPQMIMLTFDGAINDLNFETYSKIFSDIRRNANGCPIRGTFFVSHDYTNYKLVEAFYSQGHEIAVGSVSRRQGLEDESEDAWIGEMVTMRDILTTFAGVREEDIKGQRGPHLKPGREAQYEVLSAYGFTWDSTVNNPPTRVPVWPYSLEYKIPHECRAGTCPTRSFPDVWELPMNSHFQDFEFQGGFCPYLDQCALTYNDERGVVEWLISDFNRHYESNRAPYIMSLSTNWFQSPKLENALHTFIDYTLNNITDVYYVSMSEALQWVIAPQDVKQPYAPWDCDRPGKYYPPPPCDQPNSCELKLNPRFDNNTERSSGTRYMVTCQNCPRIYPWVYDSTGLGQDRDVYQLYSRSGEPAVLK